LEDSEKSLLSKRKRYQDKDARLYGLKRREFMQLGFEFADLNGSTRRFNKEKKLSGEEWVGDFCEIWASC
jgi:hypothetical protein